MLGPQTPTLKQRGFSGVNHLLCGHLLLLRVNTEEEASRSQNQLGVVIARLQIILPSKTSENIPTTKQTKADGGWVLIHPVFESATLGFIQLRSKIVEQGMQDLSDKVLTEAATCTQKVAMLNPRIHQKLQL